MNKKSSNLVSSDPYWFGNGFDYLCTLNNTSSLEELGMFTELPYLRFVISANIATISGWREVNRASFTHEVIGYVESRMRDVIKHFFGDTLPFDEAAWRFEINSPGATRHPSRHAHLLIAHKDLFGEKGPIRQCVDSLLKPEKLVAHAIEAREQEAARVLMSAPIADSREEVVRKTLRAFDNIRWRMPGAVAQTRSPNSDAHEQLVKAILQEMDTPTK